MSFTKIPNLVFLSVSDPDPHTPLRQFDAKRAMLGMDDSS